MILMIKVLIDDDILIQLGWELKAEKEGYRVDCYSSIDDFLKASDKYPKDVTIYVDSNLGADKPGEEDSKRIANLGFENIILNTGYSDLDILNFPWIKGIHIKS